MDSRARLAVVAELTGALTDEEVVARVRAGETGLYEILMRRHNQRLYKPRLSDGRRQQHVGVSDDAA